LLFSILKVLQVKNNGRDIMTHDEPGVVDYMLIFILHSKGFASEMKKIN
jgi:hypothetical protein